MDISSPVDEAVSAETAATIILGAMLITKSKYFSLPFEQLTPRKAARRATCRASFRVDLFRSLGYNPQHCPGRTLNVIPRRLPIQDLEALLSLPDRVIRLPVTDPCALQDPAGECAPRRIGTFKLRLPRNYIHEPKLLRLG